MCIRDREDIRVMKYQRLKNLVVLVTAAAYFAATFLGQKDVYKRQDQLC